MQNPGTRRTARADRPNEGIAAGYNPNGLMRAMLHLGLKAFYLRPIPAASIPVLKSMESLQFELSASMIKPLPHFEFCKSDWIAAPHILEWQPML